MPANSPALPAVSIVIPTYNTERYLLEAIDSVLKQTYPNIELIVVDDGSTDNTPALLEAFQGRFRCYRQANAGQSAAMNFGWHHSSGELIGYLSADDRLHPEAVESIVAVMGRHPEIVLAYPDFCIIDETSHYVRTVITPGYSADLLVGNFHCLPGPGALFRQEAFNRAGDWNTALRSIPDMDFFLRLCQQGEFIRVEKALADFRIHSESTTYSPSTPERADEPVRVVQDLFKSMPTDHPLQRWRKRSTANAFMLSGFMHGFSGRRSLYISRMLKAARLSPQSVFSRKSLSYLLAILKGHQ